MKVWVVRHGESVTNKKGLWTGWSDVPLTEKGEEDAAKAGKLLSDVKFDKIYSSDLMRARRTAEIAIPNCEYTATKMLREINVGYLSNNPLNTLTAEQKDIADKEGYGAYDGETKAEFHDRIAQFMKQLEASDFSNVALFSHGGLLRNLLEIVIGIELPQRRISCENCTVAIFEYNGSTWKLHSWINLI